MAVRNQKQRLKLRRPLRHAALPAVIGATGEERLPLRRRGSLLDRLFRRAGAGDLIIDPYTRPRGGFWARLLRRQGAMDLLPDTRPPYHHGAWRRVLNLKSGWEIRPGYEVIANRLRGAAAERTARGQIEVRRNERLARTEAKRLERLRRESQAVRFAKDARIVRRFTGRSENAIRRAAAPQLAALLGNGFAIVEERVDTSIDPGAAMAAGRLLFFAPREVTLEVVLRATRTARVAYLPPYRAPLLSRGNVLRLTSTLYYGAIVGAAVAAVAAVVPLFEAAASFFRGLGG
jgi:hypothetical protein